MYIIYQNFQCSNLVENKAEKRRHRIENIKLLLKNNTAINSFNIFNICLYVFISICVFIKLNKEESNKSDEFFINEFFLVGLFTVSTLLNIALFMSKYISMETKTTIVIYLILIIILVVLNICSVLLLSYYSKSENEDSYILGVAFIISAFLSFVFGLNAIIFFNILKIKYNIIIKILLSLFISGLISVLLFYKFVNFKEIGKVIAIFSQ